MAIKQTVQKLYHLYVYNEKNLSRVYGYMYDREISLEISVWHREACRVMTNSDLLRRILLSHPYTRVFFLFTITLSIILKDSKKFLNMVEMRRKHDEVTLIRDSPN